MKMTVPPDCLFYQAMDLPGVGFLEGSWDHRETAGDYLGHVDFSGKQVLDVGPANGFFSFEMERRGAEVIALDLGPHGDWDAVPHPYVEPSVVRATLHDNVRRVENAFWFAHRALGSKVKLLHGSVYGTPDVVSPVAIGLMGNVLQHFRDPFLAIERVAQVVTDTLIITEAMWETDHAFLATPALRLIPRADTPYCDHSWWQVSPALVIEILRLLGFARPSLRYHQQRFVGSATDERTRLVKHFTVIGTRPRALDESHDQSKFRIAYPSDTWHAEERGALHNWRWSSASCATMSIVNVGDEVCRISIVLGLASIQHDTIRVRLNGLVVWTGEVVGSPTPVLMADVVVNPGVNTLEFRASKQPIRHPHDPRSLSFAVYDMSVST
jgi:hypothetical protein